VTGAVLLEQPQYQASELLIGVITHGFRVAERPATIHRRQVGKCTKGNNALYALSFAKVVFGTWWRERRRRREPAARPAGHGPTAPGQLADQIIAREPGAARASSPTGRFRSARPAGRSR
jgi:hypothetical protein